VLYYSYADVAQWQSTVFVKRLLEVRFLSSAFKITYMESPAFCTSGFASRLRDN
jgi:hypothetical protein